MYLKLCSYICSYNYFSVYSFIFEIEFQYRGHSYFIVIPRYECDIRVYKAKSSIGVLITMISNEKTWLVPCQRNWNQHCFKDVLYRYTLIEQSADLSNWLFFLFWLYSEPALHEGLQTTCAAALKLPNLNYVQGLN